MVRPTECILKGASKNFSHQFKILGRIFTRITNYLRAGIPDELGIQRRRKDNYYTIDVPFDCIK